MDRYQYLALMGACLLITLPLEFVFQARVYRRPRRLVRALWFPALVFLIWDLVAVARDLWFFNADYITGVKIPGALPIEEVVFFVAIPLCALLTFEASRRTLKR